MKNKESNILVSVSTITYNHARFLRQCLDGILMQEPPTCITSSESLANSHSPIASQASWLEILIHDDCSTDGTTDIVREYAEKYPDIVKPMYETENQWKLGHTVGSAEWNYPRATGKYIATCEGDDYWTDPLKLQKQVEFMEAHPEYSVCFTTFRNHVVKTDEYLETDPTRLLKANGNPEGMDIDLNLYFKAWYTQPLTMLFRADALDFDLYKKYKYYRDMHEIYHLLKNGKCRLMNFDSGVRNVHEGGVASMIGNKKQLINSMEIAEELYKKNKDKYTKKFLLNTIGWALMFNKPWSRERLKYANRVWQLNHDLIEWVKVLKRK